VVPITIKRSLRAGDQIDS